MIRIKKQISHYFIINFLILSIACSTSKKYGDIPGSTFKKYLDSRNIDVKDLNDSNYSDYYMDFLNDEEKSVIINNLFLKANKVYVYQGPNVITFCVFSDDGNEYLNRVYKVDITFLTAPVNGIINLNKKIKLEFLGNLELKDSIIKISRNTRALSGKEWDECDVGYIQKDTIWFIENYDTRKYQYKKKWLAKKYKTNFKLIFQPNLKATRYEGDETHNPYYLIEGFFKAEKNE